MTSIATEVTWIQSLFHKLGMNIPALPDIYCNKIDTTYLCVNPLLYLYTKHRAIDFHFVLDQVKINGLCASSIFSTDQLADALTHPLLQ